MEDHVMLVVGNQLDVLKIKKKKEKKKEKKDWASLNKIRVNWTPHVRSPQNVSTSKVDRKHGQNTTGKEESIGYLLHGAAHSDAPLSWTLDKFNSGWHVCHCWCQHNDVLNLSKKGQMDRNNLTMWDTPCLETINTVTEFSYITF